MGTNGDLRSIYVRMLLSHFEEKISIELLLDFEYVFPRSYKEMLGFDLKVAVHQLMVKHGV